MKKSLICLFVITLFLLLIETVATQAIGEDRFYWQYDASGPIKKVVAIDVEQDGFSEFVVVSEPDRLELVRSDGISLWPVPMMVSDTVQAVVGIKMKSAVDSAESTSVQLILVGSSNNLILSNPEGEQLWKRSLMSGAPIESLFPIDIDSDNQDELLVLQRDGKVSLLTSMTRIGYEVGWTQSLKELTNPTFFLQWHGSSEKDRALTVATANASQSQITRINIESGVIDWQKLWQAEEITAMTPYDEGIAVGTKGGGVHLLSADGSSRWLPRTLNKSIVALASTKLQANEPLLMVATETGKWIAYKKDGSRIWDKAICFEDEKWVLKEVVCADPPRVSVLEILPLLAEPGRSDQLPHYGILVKTEQITRLLLFDANHELSADYEALPIPQSSQWIDANSDNVSELLVARFGTIGLLSGGTLSRSAVETWSYRLGGLPQDVIFSDIGQDGTNELFIATGQNVHSIDTTLGAARWVTRLNGDVSHLLVLDLKEGIPIAPNPLLDESSTQSTPVVPDISPALVVAYNQIATKAGETDVGRLTLLNTNDGGQDKTFEGVVDGRITAVLLVRDNSTRYYLYVGTSIGNIYQYKIAPLLNKQVWEWQIVYLDQKKVNGDANEPIDRIAELTHGNGKRLFVTTSKDIYEPHLAMPIDVGPSGLPSKITTDSGCRIPSDLLFFLEYDINPSTACFEQSINTWRSLFGTMPVLRRVETIHYRWIPSKREEWKQALKEGQESPKIYSDVLATFYGDFTGDGRRDFAIGSRDGTMELDLNEEITPINYGSSVIKIVGSNKEKSAELVVITGNSIVHFLRFAPDYPPFLTALQIEESNEEYKLTVQVLDIEQNPIKVQLQSVSDNNQIKEEKTTQFNVNQLSWQLKPDTLSEPFQYQLSYQDGDQKGSLTRRELHVPIKDWSNIGDVALVLMVVVSISVVVVLFFFQQQQSSEQAKRFFKKLQRTPNQILVELEKKYGKEESAEWLLHLTNLARRKNQVALAGLANGLFFLTDQPAAGITLIHTTLDELNHKEEWQRYGEWHSLFSTTQKLLEALDITQIMTLQQELTQTIEFCEAKNFPIPPYPRLRYIVDYLQRSEESEQVDERLLNLNEASSHLRNLRNDSHYEQHRLSYILAKSVIGRWSGLVSAEIESLRGRANLEVKLQTLKIISASSSRLALELFNSGRSSAENIIIRLQDGAAKPINEAVQEITALAPHRSIQVTFVIQPPETEDFRIVFSIQFDDRQRAGKQFEYANLVSVIAPTTTFKPVANPYAPGTPLQKDSDMFFGRKELFQFIAEQAPRLAQQRVLIMVGQRRTGKTSALLRLSRHLPENLIPIYIDCQSLGALPGEAALFQDIAWLVEDVLMAKGIDFIAPPLDATNANPLNWFKREFIPAVRQKISAETTLVLVFDEFEAFENLVDDKILPRVLFHHLRHLMQHCQGVCFVFVGTHLLEQMSADYWSVLFNIALYKEIEYLDEQSARALITQPVAPAIRYDELALAHIWRITAGHPYFLQLVCYSLIKHANATGTSYLTISDVNATVDEMLALGEVHFAYIWQQSNAAERIVLIAVSHLINRDNPFKTADIINAIAPYEIRLTAAEISSALHGLVQHNIMREINRSGVILYELKIKIVGFWIERTKSLSALYTASKQSTR